MEKKSKVGKKRKTILEKKEKKEKKWGKVGKKMKKNI
jgi:hypothetical protein